MLVIINEMRNDAARELRIKRRRHMKLHAVAKSIELELKDPRAVQNYPGTIPEAIKNLMNV